MVVAKDAKFFSFNSLAIFGVIKDINTINKNNLKVFFHKGPPNEK
jgi:hypothetical protein